jgi:hypothetical protein
MIIIADTGPVISLAIIDKLNLLAELYGENDRYFSINLLNDILVKNNEGII